MMNQAKIINPLSTVEALYEALSSRDVVKVHKLLSQDVEWWYHGPPHHQYLMWLLTGASELNRGAGFNFVPLSINAFGSMVVVEGHDEERSITWVHAWTLDENGIIGIVREYLNTSVTVTLLDTTSSPSASPSSSTTSSSSSSCQNVWKSQHSQTDVPCLVLPI